MENIFLGRSISAMKRVLSEHESLVSDLELMITSVVMGSINRDDYKVKEWSIEFNYASAGSTMQYKHNEAKRAFYERSR